MSHNPQVFTYDPADIELTIDVIPINSAFGADGVTLSRDGNHVEEEDGVKGDVALNYNRVKRGTLEVSLITGSLHDQMFNEIQALGNKYTFLVTFKVKSLNLKLITTGWYKTMPDVAATATRGSRTHVIGLLNAVPSHIENIGNLAGTIRNAVA